MFRQSRSATVKPRAEPSKEQKETPEGPELLQESKGKSHRSKYARRVQTEKARMQRRLNQQRASLNKSSGSSNLVFKCTTFADHLQELFFTGLFNRANSAGSRLQYDGNDKGFDKDRARSVFSLILGLVAVLSQMFAKQDSDGQRGNSTGPIFHIVNTHIVDDTSIRMRGPAHGTDRTSVFTIMNSVQGVHLRSAADLPQFHPDYSEEPECCLSLRIPTPLTVLENPDARGIYQSFIDTAIITSRGLGGFFRRLGLARDLIPESSWRTFVFIGDALKANEAAYREECSKMANRRGKDGRHLALRIRCAIHQCCLIRKPVVLMQPGLWTTVTRLSHLFESMSFRKSFAKTLAKLVASDSFTYLPVAQLPPASIEWKRANEKLRSSFRCQSKLRRKNMCNILDFLNGDLASDQIFHFCQQGPGDAPCCEGKEDSLNKCLRLLVPFMARGYQPPLLYRFKRYDEAISYVTFGTSVHKLLVKTLNAMQFENLADPADADQSRVIDKLMCDVDWGAESPGTAEAAFNDNDDVLNQSFAAVNAKRKQQVHQEVIKQSFRQSSLILDFIIAPMDGLINSFLSRSHHLTLLTLLQSHDSRWQTASVISKDMFLSLVSGSLGKHLIQLYFDMLSSGFSSLGEIGLDLASRQNLQTVFTMTLIMVSDIWRRFVHEFDTFPYKLFSLLTTTDLEGFVSKWDSWQKLRASCPNCFDAEMGHRILDAFGGNLSSEPFEVQADTFQCVTALLHDVATYAPVSSDPVEVKNGQVQQSTRSGSGGAVKAPLAAKETSFLGTLIRDFELVKHWVEEKTLPAKRTVSGILRRCGQPSSNQHSTVKHRASRLAHEGVISYMRPVEPPVVFRASAIQQHKTWISN